MQKTAFAKHLRNTATPAECRLWAVLSRRQRHGFKFRRQVPLGSYFVDFASFDAGIVVELDGGQHCESAQDAVRDAWLAAEGWEVVRYWNPDVLHNLAGVVEDLDTRLVGRVPRKTSAGKRRPPPA